MRCMRSERFAAMNSSELLPALRSQLAKRRSRPIERPGGTVPEPGEEKEGVLTVRQEEPIGRLKAVPGS